MHKIPPNPLVLIDGSSYFYRAFHALPPLMNSKGRPTGAVYGVLNMIRRLIKDYEPQHIAVVFDAKGKTFRDDLYTAYKATRPPMPDDLRDQFSPLIEIIEAMGIPLLIIDGVEADDVIGTLAKEASDAQQFTLISTGDKDMAQLVNPYIVLVNTMNDTFLDETTVPEKFGVKAEQIVDYLTLIGDKVDNIPGVPNVGPKTAEKWLNQYDNLENIIEHAKEISGKIGENLRESLHYLPLSKKLVTLKTDVELPTTYHELICKQPDREKLISLFKELEFRSLLSEFLEKTPKEQTKNYEIILSEKQFCDWLTRLENADLISFDTETTDLNYINAEIVGVSFAVAIGEAAYIPLAHDYEGAPQQLSRDSVLSRLKPLLENSKKLKLGQNLKYDMSVLENHGIQLQGIAFDTMLESYVFNSTASRHNMDALALKYLGKNTIHFEDIAGTGSKQLTFNKIPIEIAGPYAAEDADISLQLHTFFWPKIVEEPGLKYTFEAVDLPLISVLSRMERQGVLVNVDALLQQSKEIQKRLNELESQAHHVSGEVFNLSSPKQLQEILFNKLKLPVIKKTPKGQPSTGEEVLQDLALDYPLPKLILEYRSLSKLKSTYTDTLPLQVNPKTGRVHTSYNQAVAATGRLSSTDPNLQNIPIRTEEGRRIREAFIARPKYKIVSADYSQIELRIMAHLSQDKGLVKAFQNGHDVHRATASEVFGVAFDEVTSEQRRSAKVINFGLIYGMSAFGLAKNLGLSREEAQAYIDLYFHRYPGVKEYMENTRQKARELGYVETLYGRRLYLPEIHSSHFQRQQAAERTAINAPMQGTAADFIKLAMIQIDDYLQHANHDASMIMQVHDELVFEVAEAEVSEFVKIVEKYMCGIASLEVPLQVDIGVGDNWNEAH